MNKQLVLEFKTELNDDFVLRINDPREDLTSELVQMQMQAIIAANIFDVKGANLAHAVGAYTREVITTQHFGE